MSEVRLSDAVLKVINEIDKGNVKAINVKIDCELLAPLLEAKDAEIKNYKQDIVNQYQYSKFYHAKAIEQTKEIERLKAAGETCIKSYQKTIAELQNEIKFFPSLTEQRNLHEKIQQLEQQLAEKDAVLSWYASVDNWHHKNFESVEYILINEEDMGVGDFQFNEITDDEWVGGKRAREVMQKYKGEG